MSLDETAAGRARVESLLELRRWDDAVAQLAPLLASVPTDATLLVLLTRAHLGADRADEALEAANTAIAASPDSYAAHFWRATALLACSEPATDAAERAVALAPHNSYAWFLLTRARLRSDDVAGALTAAEQSLHLSPNEAIGHHALGLVHLRTHEWAPAEADYRAALTHAPTNTTYLNNLGLALLRQGDAKRAAEHFVSAGELAPASADTYRRNAAAAVRTYVQNPDAKARREIGIPLAGGALVVVIVLAKSPVISLLFTVLLVVIAVIAYQRRARQLPDAARHAAQSVRREERHGIRTELRQLRRNTRHAFWRAPWHWSGRQLAVTGAVIAVVVVTVVALFTPPRQTIIRIPAPVTTTARPAP